MFPLACYASPWFSPFALGQRGLFVGVPSLAFPLGVSPPNFIFVYHRKTREWFRCDFLISKDNLLKDTFGALYKEKQRTLQKHCKHKERGGKVILKYL